MEVAYQGWTVRNDHVKFKDDELHSMQVQAHSGQGISETIPFCHKLAMLPSICSAQLQEPP